jgi:hypothetical protein
MKAVQTRHWMWPVAGALALALALTALMAFGAPQVVSAAANDDANLTIAHFAPFADTEGTAVDVWVNGAVALPGLTYPEQETDVALPGGDYLVQVALSGTTSIVISNTLTVADDMDYTVAAIGGANGWTPEYYVLVNDAGPSAEGQGQVRITHLAPFASTSEGTEVDICTEAGQVVTGLANIPYKASTGYLGLPAGDYDLKVTAADGTCGTTLIDVPAFTLDEGMVLDVFAIGDGVNQAPSIVVNDQTPAAPVTVNVAHYAPFADTLEDTSVTVRVNGGDVLTDFQFAEVETGISLPAGEYLVEILPTGSTTVAISRTIMLEAGGDYSLVAQGDGANQPLALKALDNATAAPAAGNGKLRVGHFAPFSDDLAATAVDICLDSGVAVPGLTNVPYNVVSSPFLELPAGEYDLLIALAGTNCATVALDIPSVTLADGQVSDAYAIGKVLDDEASPIALQISTILGITLTPPAAPATVDVAHFAAFGDGSVAAAGITAASVTVRVDGVDALTGFEFGDVVTDVKLPAGARLIEILPTGTETVAISATVNLAADGNYTVIAIGDDANQPLELKVLDNATDAPAAGFAKLRIGHLAPFSADLAATAVDICTQDGVVVPGLSGVQYNVVSDYLTLPMGNYDLLIAVAGTNCQTVALDVDPVMLGDGEIADAYAIGRGDDAFPLTIASISGLTPGGPTAIDETDEPTAPASSTIFLPLVR